MYRYLFLLLLLVSFNAASEELEQKTINLVKKSIKEIDSLFAKLIAAVQACDPKTALKLKEEFQRQVREIRKYEKENKSQARYLWPCRGAMTSASMLSKITTTYAEGRLTAAIGHFESDFSACKRVIDKSIPKSYSLKSTWPAKYAKPDQCLFPEEAEKYLGNWRLTEYKGKGSSEVTSGSLLFIRPGRCKFILNHETLDKFGENCRFWYKDGVLNLYNADDTKITTRFKVSYDEQKMTLNFNNSGSAVFEKW